MQIKKTIPLLGIVAYSGTGKTTLLTQLIPLLKQYAINCAVIKHSHHNMDIDIPGKDSYQLRQAGANQTIVACDQRWALMTETPTTPVDLAYLAQQFDPTTIDLILVEGFKQEPIDKIVLYRQQVGKPLLGLLDSHAIALASDQQYSSDQQHKSDQQHSVDIPLLDINQPAKIAEFIYQWLTEKIDIT